MSGSILRTTSYGSSGSGSGIHDYEYEYEFEFVTSFSRSSLSTSLSSSIIGSNVTQTHTKRVLGYGINLI